MTNRSEDEPAKLNSPACSMPEADDAYTGYAGKAELVAFVTCMGFAGSFMTTPRNSSGV
jgi:hypothetical protein